jgi:hypothetical protein
LLQSSCPCHCLYADKCQNIGSLQTHIGLSCTWCKLKTKFSAHLCSYGSGAPYPFSTNISLVHYHLLQVCTYSRSTKLDIYPFALTVKTDPSAYLSVFNSHYTYIRGKHKTYFNIWQILATALSELLGSYNPAAWDSVGELRYIETILVIDVERAESGISAIRIFWELLTPVNHTIQADSYNDLT